MTIKDKTVVKAFRGKIIKKTATRTNWIVKMTGIYVTTTTHKIKWLVEANITMILDRIGMTIIGEKTLAIATTRDTPINLTLTGTTFEIRTEGTLLVPALQVRSTEETTKAASNTKTATLIATTKITRVSEEVLCAIKTKERSNALNLKLWSGLPLPNQETSPLHFKKACLKASLNLPPPRKCGAFPAPIAKKGVPMVSTRWISRTAVMFTLREYPGERRKTRWEKFFQNLGRLKMCILSRTTKLEILEGLLTFFTLSPKMPGGL